MKQAVDNLTIDMYENSPDIPYDYEAFARECYLFNMLTGQADKTSEYDVQNQVALIEEEVIETIEAIFSNDAAETLKEIVDVMVTVLGLLQKLENKGYDVTTAMKRVAENNLSKFVATQEAAESTQQYYTDKQVPTYIAKHKSGLYAIKRIADDKLMKPVGYESVDLSDLV